VFPVTVPPVIVPLVVIALAPLLMAPNPAVTDPLLSAPVVTRLLLPAVGDLPSNCVWIALVTPVAKLICAPVAVIAVPPIFQELAVRFGRIAVVPSSRSSKVSSVVFHLPPQVSALDPTSGFTRLNVVVVVSAISNHRPDL